MKAAKPEALEDQELTLAASLRRVRKERGLLQREVAEIIGVSHTSILDWEAGKEPEVRMYPRIIAFLGFEPWPDPETLTERLWVERRKRGWSIRNAAKALGVDKGTWGRWEGGKHPQPREWRKLSNFFSWSMPGTKV